MTEALASVDDLEFLRGGGPGKDDFGLADPVHNDTSLLGLVVIEGLLSVDNRSEFVTVDDNSLAFFKGLFVGILAVSAWLDHLEHFVEFLLRLGNDVNLKGNGSGCRGLITGDHNNFDTSFTAFLDRDVDLGAGRIIEGDNTDEGEVPHGEPALFTLGIKTIVNKLGLVVAERSPSGCSVRIVVLGEITGIKIDLGESEDTLAHETEAVIGSVYIELHLLVEVDVVDHFIFVLHENATATLEDLLRSTLKVDGDVF